MKRIIGIILIICLAFSIVGCDKKKDEDETPAQNADDVVIKVSQTDVLVGGTITFKITLNNVKGVKSLAIRPEMDTESFETVSARPLVNGLIADGSNGIVTLVFSESTDMNDTTVAEFTVKAKTVGTNLAVAFSVSVMDANDNKIAINQTDSIFVNVKY